MLDSWPRVAEKNFEKVDGMTCWLRNCNWRSIISSPAIDMLKQKKSVTGPNCYSDFKYLSSVAVMKFRADSIIFRHYRHRGAGGCAAACATKFFEDFGRRRLYGAIIFLAILYLFGHHA
jgi:hypothetical protein